MEGVYFIFYFFFFFLCHRLAPRLVESTLVISDMRFFVAHFSGNWRGIPREPFNNYKRRWVWHSAPRCEFSLACKSQSITNNSFNHGRRQDHQHHHCYLFTTSLCIFVMWVRYWVHYRPYLDNLCVLPWYAVRPILGLQEPVRCYKGKEIK